MLDSKRFQEPCTKLFQFSNVYLSVIVKENNAAFLSKEILILLWLHWWLIQNQSTCSDIHCLCKLKHCLASSHGEWSAEMISCLFANQILLYHTPWSCKTFTPFAISSAILSRVSQCSCVFEKSNDESVPSKSSMTIACPCSAQQYASIFTIYLE